MAENADTNYKATATVQPWTNYCNLYIAIWCNLIASLLQHPACSRGTLMSDWEQDYLITFVHAQNIQKS